LQIALKEAERRYLPLLKRGVSLVGFDFAGSNKEISGKQLQELTQFQLQLIPTPAKGPLIQYLIKKNYRDFWNED